MMDPIEAQVRALNIPYPQKYLLELEMKQDLEFAASEGGAVEPSIPQSVLNDLQAIHSTSLHRLLQRLGDQRKTVETLMAFVPLLTGLFFIMEEEIMVDFIREGGLGMYAILGIGGFMLGKELLNGVRLIVVKDHSAENLRIDTTSVLLGCLALMLVSIGSTLLGLYKSAAVAVHPHPAYELLVLGAKESLTNLVLSSFLCALIVLAHYGTRRTLALWRAPFAG
jgi:hypothetical protein